MKYVAAGGPAHALCDGRTHQSLRVYYTGAEEQCRGGHSCKMHGPFCRCSPTAQLPDYPHVRYNKCSDAPLKTEKLPHGTIAMPLKSHWNEPQEHGGDGLYYICDPGFTFATSKDCSSFVVGATHHAEEAATGNFGPYLNTDSTISAGPLGVMTQEECIAKCDATEKCAGWTWRKSNPDHPNFEQCWLLDATHVGYAPKAGAPSNEAFHSGTCKYRNNGAHVHDFMSAGLRVCNRDGTWGPAPVCVNKNMGTPGHSHGDDAPNVSEDPRTHCVCENGTPMTGGLCTNKKKDCSSGTCKNLHNVCASCNEGFHLQDFHCIATTNACTCANGQAATGALCPGEEFCTTCDAGYHLFNHECKKHNTARYDLAADVKKDTGFNGNGLSHIDGKPSLVSHGYEADQTHPHLVPLEHCHGDCDHDGHCKSGYKCYQQNNKSPIPGCEGVPKEAMDYCVHK
jgi:hypothetical protein